MIPLSGAPKWAVLSSSVHACPFARRRGAGRYERSHHDLVERPPVLGPGAGLSGYRGDLAPVSLRDLRADAAGPRRRVRPRRRHRRQGPARRRPGPPRHPALHLRGHLRQRRGPPRVRGQPPPPRAPRAPALAAQPLQAQPPLHQDEGAGHHHLRPPGERHHRLRAAARRVRGRGARLPVPRERSRLHLAVDGAGGHLLLLRAQRRRREARPHGQERLRQGRAGHAGAVLAPARAGPQRGAALPRLHVPADHPAGQRAPQGLRLRQAQPQRPRHRRGGVQRRRRGEPLRRALLQPLGGRAPRPDPRRGAARPAGRLPRRRQPHAPPAGLHLRARRPPLPQLQHQVPDRRGAPLRQPGRDPGRLPRDDEARARRGVRRRGRRHPGQGPVPRREPHAVAAHLRLRERRRRRARRERVRADRRSGALQRQVQVRREQAEGRQGDHLGAHDAAPRRRHRGLPLPSPQGDRGHLQLPRRRPRSAGHLGRGPQPHPPQRGDPGQLHQERHPDRRAQPARDRGQGRQRVDPALDAVREHLPEHGPGLPLARADAPHRRQRRHRHRRRRSTSAWPCPRPGPPAPAT